MTLGELRKRDVTIVYTNHRGETARRRIAPMHLWFGATEWHPKPQWLLHAYDMDKRTWRDFAMINIVKWNAEPETTTADPKAGC